MDLVKQADTASLRELCFNEDGEDERIATVQALHRTIGEYADTTIVYIGEDIEYALLAAKDAEEKEAHESADNFYKAALHGHVTSYYVDSYQQGDVLPWDKCKATLDLVCKGEKINTRAKYDAALRVVVAAFVYARE